MGEQRGTVTSEVQSSSKFTAQKRDKLQTDIVHDPILHGGVTLLWEG